MWKFGLLVIVTQATLFFSALDVRLVFPVVPNCRPKKVERIIIFMFDSIQESELDVANNSFLQSGAIGTVFHLEESSLSEITNFPVHFFGSTSGIDPKLVPMWNVSSFHELPLNDTSKIRERLNNSLIMIRFQGVDPARGDVSPARNISVAKTIDQIRTINEVVGNGTTFMLTSANVVLGGNQSNDLGVYFLWGHSVVQTRYNATFPEIRTMIRALLGLNVTRAPPLLKLSDPEFERCLTGVEIQPKTVFTTIFDTLRRRRAQNYTEKLNKVIAFVSSSEERIEMSTGCKILTFLAYAGWLLVVLSYAVDHYIKSEGLFRIETETFKTSLNGTDTLFMALCVVLVTTVLELGWSLVSILLILVVIIVWRLFAELIVAWTAYVKEFNPHWILRFVIFMLLIAAEAELITWGLQFGLILYILYALVLIYKYVVVYFKSSGKLALVEHSVSFGALIPTYYFPGYYHPKSLILLNFGGAFWITASSLVAVYVHHHILNRFVMFAATFHYVCSLVVSNLINSLPPATPILVLAFILVVTSIFLPLFGTTAAKDRLLHLSVCSASAFILVSSSGEPLALFFVLIQSFLTCLFDRDSGVDNQPNPLGALFFVIALFTSMRCIGFTDNSNEYFTNIVDNLMNKGSLALTILLLGIKVAIVVSYLLVTFVKSHHKLQITLNFLLVLTILNLIACRLFLQIALFPSSGHYFALAFFSGYVHGLAIILTLTFSYALLASGKSLSEVLPLGSSAQKEVSEDMGRTRVENRNTS